MPYPRHFTWQKWAECDRCGFDFPLGELSRDFTRRRVCPYCYDEKGHDEYMAELNLPIEELTLDEDNDIL